MAHPYSVDLRKRVIAAIDNNIDIEKVSSLFNVCVRVIYKWLKLRSDTGNLNPKSGYQKGHSHKIMDWDQFKKFATKNHNLTIPQMTIEWEKLTGVKVSKSVIQRGLKKIGFTSKKKHLNMLRQMKKREKNI